LIDEEDLAKAIHGMLSEDALRENGADEKKAQETASIEEDGA